MEWRRLLSICFDLGCLDHPLYSGFCFRVELESAVINAIRSGGVPTRARRGMYASIYPSPGSAFERIERYLGPETDVNISLNLISCPDGYFVEAEADGASVVAWLRENALPAELYQPGGGVKAVPNVPERLLKPFLCDRAHPDHISAELEARDHWSLAGLFVKFGWTAICVAALVERNLPINSANYFHRQEMQYLTAGYPQHSVSEETRHRKQEIMFTRVLSYDEAAGRANLVRRSLERRIADGEGPAIVHLGKRRRGILEHDLEAWLQSRRHAPPGEGESTPATGEGS